MAISLQILRSAQGPQGQKAGNKAWSHTSHAAGEVLPATAGKEAQVNQRCPSADGHLRVSEVIMATQTIPTFEQMHNPAAVPAVRRRLVPRPPLPISTVRPAARREARQAEERQRVLVEMLPLVKRMAFKIREHLPSHVEVDDLIGNGVLGLVDAISKFDTEKRVKLESYARHRVRGSILDGLRSVDPASRDLRRKNKKIQKLYRELEVRLGRPVKDEEIAAALGLSLEQWHSALNEIQSVGFDFGARVISAGPTTKRPSVEPSLLAGDDADPFDLCYRREQSEILARALSHLRERDRQIINLYYQQELTMKQIAEHLGIDESRVSQLHSAALARLKASVSSLLHPRQPRTSVAPALSMSVGGAI
jgi:RNA polymerase sigma factor for flagellar operon FliA